MLSYYTSLLGPLVGSSQIFSSKRCDTVPRGLYHSVCVCARMRLATQLCPTLCDPMDCLWDCHFLFQGIFLMQGLKPSVLHLPHWQADSLPLEPPYYSTAFSISKCLSRHHHTRSSSHQSGEVSGKMLTL